MKGSFLVFSSRIPLIISPPRTAQVEALVADFRLCPTLTEYLTLLASKPDDVPYADVAKRLYDELSDMEEDRGPTEFLVTRLQILEYEKRDKELRDAMDQIDDEVMTEEMMDVVIRLAARKSDDNVNQQHVIRRALTFVAEELPFCAGVIEELFLHYEHQIRAFTQWREGGCVVDVADATNADSGHFLNLLGDAFFYPVKPGPASTVTMVEAKTSELDALLLPKILGWMTAARAAYVQLDLSAWMGSRPVKDGRLPRTFPELCSHIHRDSLRDEAGCGPQAPQVPAIARFAADLFKRLQQDGVRELKPNMLNCVRLCELVASFYDGEDSFVQHILRWTKTPAEEPPFNHAARSLEQSAISVSRDMAFRQTTHANGHVAPAAPAMVAGGMMHQQQQHLGYSQQQHPQTQQLLAPGYAAQANGGQRNVGPAMHTAAPSRAQQIGLPPPPPGQTQMQQMQQFQQLQQAPSDVQIKTEPGVAPAQNGSQSASSAVMQSEMANLLAISQMGTAAGSAASHGLAGLPPTAAASSGAPKSFPLGRFRS